MQRNMFKLVGGIFLAVGLAMLGGAIYLHGEKSEFIAQAERGEGEVIDLSRQRSTSDGSTSYTYAPVVRFRDKANRAHEFVSRTSSNPPSYSRGDIVTILYAPDNPSDAIVDDFFSRWGIEAIFGGMGALFSLLGGSMFAWQLRKARTRRWLLRHGTPVPVEFMEVERDRSVRVNGRHPYRVVAQGKNPFTGKLEQFLSDHLWVDPTDEMRSQQLRVFIDPNRPSRHALDMDWLTGEDSRER